MMEIDEKSTQLEEVSIDKVCRTCLNTSEELMVTLFDEDKEEKTNFDQMIFFCFGRIVPSLQNLPTKLCSECQDLIRSSYGFRSRCVKSTEILLSISNFDEHKSENKETQTDEPVLQFDDVEDDENFEGIQLQEEDVIFESPALLDLQQQQQPEQTIPTSVVKQEEEEIEALDEHFEEHLVDSKPKSEETTENPLINEENKKIHKCEKCSRSFARISHLRRHILSHDEIKSIKCSECEKRFSRIDHLNHHMQSCHSTSKPFHCQVTDCGKGFLKEEFLKKHMEAKHSSTPDAKEICTICEKKFSSKKYLRSHMRVHGNEKNFSKKDQHERPYLCSECGLRFVRNDYLVIHMRRHLGLKPYKCKFCDKGFPRATDLTVHERYHTNEKTHLCNLCGKGFQRAYNLLVHMRVHTGEKPYECNYCSKSFSQGNDLKAHIRRHTGERFKCDLCSEGFIQGYHLTHHKRTVHGLDVKSHIRRVEKFSTPTDIQIKEDHDEQETSIVFSIQDDQFPIQDVN